MKFSYLSKYIKIFLLVTFYSNLYASDYYWVGGQGNWSDFANHWATTSGGSTFYASAPTALDNVIFDDNSTSYQDTVFIDVPANCNNLSLDGATKLFQNAPLTVNGKFNLLRGDFFCNANLLNINQFKSDSSLVRTFDITNSTLNITGFDTVWVASNILFNFIQTNSTINFNYAGNNQVYFSSGNDLITYENVILSTKNITFIDRSKFNNLTIQPGTHLLVTTRTINGILNELNVTNLVANGTCSSFITIEGLPSNSITTQFNFNANANTFNLNFVRIKNSNGINGTFNATNSLDLGNNTNWNITEEPSNGTVRWINNGGNWSDPSHWSTGCVPGPNDDVVFDNLSFTLAGQQVNVDVDAYCNSMTWTGVTNLPDLTGNTNNILIKTNLTLDPNMTASFSKQIVFYGLTAGNSITTSNVVLNGDIVINSTADWTLNDNLTSTAKLIMENGVFNALNKMLSFNSVVSNSSNTRNLDFSNSTILLTGIDTTWLINPTNLTDNFTGTEIIINHTQPQLSIFDGGGLTYNNLRLFNQKSSLYGNNTFNLVEIKPSKTVLLESGSSQNIDSLIAVGFCDSIITIGCTDEFGLPANINKTGYDTLVVDYTNISNVTATVSGVKYNSATNSLMFYNTTGWSNTLPPQGNNFYWVNGTGSWSDLTHWQSPLGVPATCLPNFSDTVYFNNNSFTATNQIVTVDIDAFFAKMDWTGSGGWTPQLTLNQNLNCKDSIIFNNTLNVNHSNSLATIVFSPNANNSTFVTFNRPIKANVLHKGTNLNDTLFLNGNLKLDTLSNLFVASGTFDSNGDTITANSFVSIGTIPRNILLNNSFVELYNQLDFTNLTMLNAGTSQIYLKSLVNQAHFYGNGLNYYDVSLENTIPNISVIDVHQSNSFNDLTFMIGSKIRLQDNGTQNINGKLIANGTCVDSIFISSITSGTATNFTLATNDTLDVVSIKDVNVTTNNLRTYSSSDRGNNTGITFDTTPTSTPYFITPYDQCLGNTTTFTNTSTAISGNILDLTFEWDFGNGVTSTAINPTYNYSTPGKYFVNLTTTYTNLCKETYLDSVRINHPIGTLSSDDLDTTICSSTPVNFTAISSPNADSYNFFINGNSVQNTSSNTYTSTTLSNGDVITLQVTLNGCTTSSNDTLNFIVNPLPNVTLSSSDADNTICIGDSVTFTATGGHNYQFYVNGTFATFLTTNNIFSTTSLVNGDVVSVIGVDTVTSCQNNANTTFTFTVNNYPTPNLSSSDLDNVICQGDAVTFTGSNATNYEFYINGSNVQGPSTVNTFTTTNLNNGDTVKVKGSSLGCGVFSTDLYVFVVNPLPTTALNNNTGLNICAGTQVNFTASGASFYEFFINGVSVQASSPNNSYSTTSLNNGDNVYVVGDLNNCFSTSSTQTFNVTALPVVTLTNTDIDTTICQYESVTFTASGATNYQFLLDGTPIAPFSTNSSYTTTTLNNNQTVSVVGDNAGCQAQSNNYFTFTVIPSFNVNLFSSDADLTICEGENIDFTGIAGTGLINYNLYDNGILLSSNTTGNFSITSLTYGTHQIALSATKNGCTYFANDTLNVTVIPLPSITLTSSDADNIICQGDSVLFVANTANIYEFLIDGISQGAQSSNSLWLNSINNGETISVKGTTNGCSNFANSFTFTVNPVPNVTLSSDDIDNIICEGQAINFTASGATNYEFFIDGVSQGVSAVTNLSLNPTTNHLIELIGESSNCFNNATPINLIVNPNPTITVTISDSDTTICQGDFVTVTANGGATYQLLINGNPTSSPSIQNTFTFDTLQNNDIVTVQGYSTNQCFSTSANVFTFTVKPVPNVLLTSSDTDSTICLNDNVVFTATGANSYTYYVDGVQAITGPTYTTDSIQNGQIITVIGDLNGCLSTSNPLPFTVNLYPVTSIITYDTDTSICFGDTIIFKGLGAFDYEFFVNGVSQGVSNLDTFFTTTLNDGDLIYVSGINNGCAKASDTITVNVINYPNTILVSSNLTNEICFGEAVTFTTNGATTYEFYVNNVLQVPQTTNPTFVTTTLNHNDTVWAIGYNGECSTTAPQSYIITVHTLPLTLTSNGNNLICSGSNVTFTSSGADSYEFFVDGISVQGPSTNPVFTTTNIQNGQTVTVNGFSSTTGCTQQAQSSHLVTVMPVPVITALNSTTICQGDSVVLVSSATEWNQWFNNNSPIINAIDTSYTTYVAGNYYTEITLGGNGNVIALGNNSFGQLGDSTTINALNKVDTKLLQNISQIATGQNHNIALDANGVVYTWGKNDFGQLGNGTYTSQNYPYITNITTAQFITAGHQFTVAVLQNGTVMSWGKNDLGQLGQGNNSTTNFPFAVTGLNNVSKVASGKNHTIALLTDGTLMAWGDNQYGQLGVGNFTNYNSPQPLANISGIAYINCGANHSLAVDSLGNLYVWGNNSEGQLGINNIQFSNIPLLHSLTNIKMADGGFTHTIVLTNSNQLYSWGNNTNGQLGINNTNNSVVPVLISQLDAVDTIATNFNSNFALKSDKSVWSWGGNSSGQLGTENTITQISPIHISSLTGSVEFGVGENHSIFLAGFSNSCPSNTLSVVVNPSPVVTISMSNGVLTVSPTGTAYQWYIDGIVIPNATSPSFTPVTAGYYTCEVTFNGGCTSLSNEYPYQIVGVDENDFNFTIYPNPNEGQFYIKGNLQLIKTIEIYNTLGQKINDIKVNTNTTSKLLNVNIDVKTGVYYVYIINQSGNKYITKLIVE